MFLLAGAMTRAVYEDPTNAARIEDIVEGTRLLFISTRYSDFLRDNGCLVGSIRVRQYKYKGITSGLCRPFCPLDGALVRKCIRSPNRNKKGAS